MSRRSRRLLPRTVSTVALTAVVAACQAEPAVRVQVRDSAGVRIVTSRPVGDALPVAFRVGGAPVLDLALVPGATPLDFVSDAVFTDDGGVAVLEADGDLLRFDPAGRLLRRDSLDGVSLTAGPGDSVTVLTGSAREVLVLAPDGVLRRVDPGWRGPAPPGEIFAVDGGFVVLTGWSTEMLPADVVPGVRADSVHLLRFDATGALVDTVASDRGSRVGLVSLAGRISIAAPHFARVTVADARHDRIWLGTGEHDQFRRLDLQGTLQALIRRQGRTLPLSDAERAAALALRRRMAGGNPVAARVVEEVERTLPMPDSRPPYARLLDDGRGGVWAAEYPMPGEAPTSWTVYDPDGALVGTVSLPVRFRLLDVRGDLLLGHVVGGGGGTIRIYRAMPVADP